MRAPKSSPAWVILRPRVTGPRDVETEYRAIWEASSDGLVVNDAETGLVIDANPAFCRMHGDQFDRPA